MKKNQILSWVVLGIFLMTLGLWAIPGKVQASTAGSVIGTSTTTAADALSYQRKSFYAQTKFWMFYVSPPNIVFRTSPDGIIWGAQQTLRSGSAASGEQFSVWSDGTSIYYAFATGAAGTHVYFRKGTLNAAGTINWGANAEVIAVAGVSGVTYSNPSIALDSNGYAWIGYRRVQGTNKFPFITKNKNNNGTWAAAPGFPYDLAGWTAAAWAVSPIPLSSGKMVAVYVSPGHYMRARSWNGSAWVGGFTSTDATSSLNFSTVGSGDDAHIAFVNGAIRYIKYNISSNALTAEGVAQAGVSNTSAAVLSVDPTGDLHLFWAGSPTANHIFYKQNSGGKWDASALDIVNEGVEKLNSNWALTAPYSVDLSQGEIVFYLTKTASPYNVKSSRGQASISLRKTGPAQAYFGDTISYQFELKNNGKVALSNVQVTDPMLGGVIYSNPTLSAGVTVPFSVNYTVPNSAPPILVNTTQASGSYNSTQVVDSDSASVKIINPVNVKKTGPIYAFAGDQVTYTITVRNDWNQNLVITKIEDILTGHAPIAIGQVPHTLTPGQTWSHTITTTPSWQNTPFVNTVTVWALKGSHEVTASDTYTFYPLTIKKDVIGEDDNTEFEVWIKDYRKIPYPGTKPFKVSENSPKRVWLATGTHWFKEVILYPNCYRLVPDASYVIKYYPQYNSEFAEFVYEAGKTNWKEITFKNKNYCKICIDKSGPEQSCFGDKITYNFKVTNCSEIPQTGDQPTLYNVAVTDPLLGLNQSIGTLAPGAFVEFTKDYVIPQQVGALVNTATATGKHNMAHDGGFPTTTKTVYATDKHTVNVADCRKAQICGFKWDDFDGDGNWTKCNHLVFLDQFDNGTLDDWIPFRGDWKEEGGFLKQTDEIAANPSDALILYGYGDESKKYHALSYRTSATPVEGNADFGLVFYAQDDTHYFLFRVDGTNQMIGVYRRNGTDYEKIIDKTFDEAGIKFAVENGKTYGMKVNTHFEWNGIAFYFDEIAKFDKDGELVVFTVPIESFGCASGYLGLRTHLSAVDFDWAFQSAELGIEGWEIKLEGPVNATTLTGPDGSYCFTNLPAGNYKVYEVFQPGWAQTYPAAQGYYEITLNPGDNVGCVNFGNQLVCLDPPPNMISWWPGDENPWDYIDGNTGTPIGGATYGDGSVGKAFSLNGASAYVKIGNPDNLYITGDVTVDAWIKIQDLQEGQVASIAGKWGYRIDLDSYALSTVKANGQIRLVSGIGDGSTADQGLLGGVIQPNEWTHVAMTYKANTGENILYINGVNVGSRTRTGGIFPTSVNFFIGAQEKDGTTPWRFFPGLIDEVEVFGRALDEWELKALYNVGSLGKCKPQITPPPDPKVKKIFEMTVTNAQSAPPNAKYYAHLTNTAHSGTFDQFFELVGGPPVFSATFENLDKGLYDWEVYATWGSIPFLYPIKGGTNENLDQVETINEVEVTWPGNYCTYTQGYWENHPEAWPVDSLMLGNVLYNQTQLLAIFDESVGGNGLISLAHQLIAAKLNLANGAWPPAGVQTALVNADILIGNLIVPPLGAGFLLPSATSGLTDDLDHYNQGIYPDGPPHCE